MQHREKLPSAELFKRAETQGRHSEYIRPHGSHVRSGENFSAQKTIIRYVRRQAPNLQEIDKSLELRMRPCGNSMRLMSLFIILDNPPQNRPGQNSRVTQVKWLFATGDKNMTAKRIIIKKIINQNKAKNVTLIARSNIAECIEPQDAFDTQPIPDQMLQSYIENYSVGDTIMTVYKYPILINLDVKIKATNNGIYNLIDYDERIRIHNNLIFTQARYNDPQNTQGSPHITQPSNLINALYQGEYTDTGLPASTVDSEIKTMVHTQLFPTEQTGINEIFIVSSNLASGNTGITGFIIKTKDTTIARCPILSLHIFDVVSNNGDVTPMRREGAEDPEEPTEEPLTTPYIGHLFKAASGTTP